MRPVAAALWSLFALSITACNDAGTDLGLTPRQREVLVAEVRLPEGGQPVVAKLSQLLKRAASLPDVEQVAIAEALPGTMPHQTQIELEGDPPASVQPAYVEVVSPGYFGVMEMGLLRGRLFSENDGQASPSVVIINETYADQQMPSHGKELLGQRLRLGRGPWLTIVGVVQDGPGWHRDWHRPKVYIPHAQFALDGPLARFWYESKGAGAPTWLLLARVAGDRDDVAVRLQGVLGLEFLTLGERLKAYKRAMESGPSGG
jgi:hypothetical protein